MMLAAIYTIFKRPLLHVGNQTYNSIHSTSGSPIPTSFRRTIPQNDLDDAILANALCHGLLLAINLHYA